MNIDVKNWLIECLSDWREAFGGETRDLNGEDEDRDGWDELTRHIENLKQDKPIDYEEVLFHLWQHLAHNEN